MGVRGDRNLIGALCQKRLFYQFVPRGSWCSELSASLCSGVHGVGRYTPDPFHPCMPHS